MSGRGFIQKEPDRACEMCGKWTECRPYGPKLEWVCFECGQKDQAAMKRGFNRYIGGEGNA